MQSEKTKGILTLKKFLIFYANISFYFFWLFFDAILAAITARMLINVWMFAIGFSCSNSDWLWNFNIFLIVTSQAEAIQLD
jgi:hypothetical protein